MAEAQEESGIKTDTGVRHIDDLDIIISCDDHITEDFEDILSYADSKYSGMKKYLEGTNSWKSEVFSITPPLPPYGLTSSEVTIAGTKFFEKKDTLAETKLAQLDEFNIDFSIINPSILLTLPTVQSDQAAATLANGYNSWVLDQVDPSDRLKATILAAGQRPNEAAEDIDRLADEDSIVGVQLPATGWVPPISHEWYDPIYQAAQDNDLPIVMHSAYPGISTGFPLQNRWHRIMTMDKVIAHPFSQMWNLMLLLYEGIPERFPDLDFVIQESGVGWIAYWTWRLDYYYLTYGDEMPLLNKLPSDYISERFHFTSQPVGHTAGNPKHLAWAIEMAGAENIMFAADLPHSDFNPPSELFNRIVSHFDDDVIRGIMGETAAELFDID